MPARNLEAFDPAPIPINSVRETRPVIPKAYNHAVGHAVEAHYFLPDTQRLARATIPERSFGVHGP